MTETKKVQITAPSSSTEHVYIPAGKLSAEAGMTWSEWLDSEYNNIGVSQPSIKNSDYEDVEYDEEIIPGSEYGFITIKLLADVVQIGDYVNYPVMYENVTDSWGKTSVLTGWRVIGIEGENVKLVSAGVPLIFNYFGGPGTSAVFENKLTNEFFNISVSSDHDSFSNSGFDKSKSLNIIFAENKFTAIEGDLPKVRAMKKEDIFDATGYTTWSSSMDLANDKYNNLFAIGERYYLASASGSGTIDSNICAVYENGEPRETVLENYGVRPVVYLKAETETVGQDDNGVWQLSM